MPVWPAQLVSVNHKNITSDKKIEENAGALTTSSCKLFSLFHPGNHTISPLLISEPGIASLVKTSTDGNWFITV